MAVLSNIECFLLDMDGTFYLGDRLIPGSIAFIEALRAQGRKFLFLTNNSSRNADYYVEKLRRLGLTVPKELVLTSGQATGILCAQRFSGARAFVLGNEYLVQELRDEGVSVDDESPDYVIVGYDTTLTYASLTRVCDLVRAGLPYVATHPDLNCPTDGGFAPDIGAIMAFIEASTGRAPDLIVGKPHEGIVGAALHRTGVPKERTAMVGDRLYTDVQTALSHGMTGILVMSGETTEAMLAASKIQPHHCYPDLASMIESL